MTLVLWPWHAQGSPAHKRHRTFIHLAHVHGPPTTLCTGRRVEQTDPGVTAMRPPGTVIRSQSIQCLFLCLRPQSKREGLRGNLIPTLCPPQGPVCTESGYGEQKSGFGSKVRLV